MRLKDGFITHVTGGEQIMVGTGSVSFAGLVRSNSTAAFIVDMLKADTTKADIVDAMEAVYDAPREVLEKDVESILEKLRGIGALNE